MSNEKLKIKSKVCSNCGGRINVDDSKDTVECSYCGTSYAVSELMGESDAVRIEKIKSKTQQEIEKEKIKHEIEKNKNQEEKEDIAKFKKSKFSKVLLIFFAISVLLFFASNAFFVKIITFVQAVLFIGAWLMGTKTIKEPVKGLRNVLAIIAFVLIMPIIGIGGGSSLTKSEKIVWNDIAVSEILPKPKSDKGQIVSNSDEHLSVYIHNSSKEDYSNYLESCKQKGFTIEPKKDTTSYDAYNNEGYKLRIYYSEYSKEYNISLDAPMPMKENAWLDTPLSKLVPKPTSNVGKIESESEKYFEYYAGQTSQDEFATYANSVLNAGFSKDYKKTDTYFYGTNSDGYKVNIEYKGNKIMRITINAPENNENKENNTAISTESLETTGENKVENTPTTEESKVETTKTPENTSSNSSNNNGIRKEFKEAMDSYEKFFDEYIAFMKKYEKSNGTDASLMVDYAKYMSQYAKTLKEFEDMKDDDMNTEEAQYYIQVQNRINQKLLEVAQ